MATREQKGKEPPKGMLGILAAILGATHLSNLLTFVFGIVGTLSLLATLGYIRTPTPNITVTEQKPDPGSRAGARQELKDRNLPFNSDGFSQAVTLDDPEVVELYLRAGSSPNDYIANTSYYPPFMALQNSGHEIPIIDLLKKYGANFNLENTKALRYPFEEPLTMGQEALLQASTEGRADIVKHLLSMGVSAHFFVEHAREFHCSTNPMVRDSSIKTMQGAGVSIHACGQ